MGVCSTGVESVCCGTCREPLSDEGSHAASDSVFHGVLGCYGSTAPSVEKGHVDAWSMARSVGGYLLNLPGGMLPVMSGCVTVCSVEVDRGREAMLSSC